MIAPGEKVDEMDFEIIHAMKVKSLITNPATGHKMSRSDSGSVRACLGRR